jgi:hypothetical protein
LRVGDLERALLQYIREESLNEVLRRIGVVPEESRVCVERIPVLATQIP